MAYGARLESVLGESPRGFESPILRPLIDLANAGITTDPRRSWHRGMLAEHLPVLIRAGYADLAAIQLA